jgi:hypothetical protein
MNQTGLPAGTRTVRLTAFTGVVEFGLKLLPEIVPAGGISVTNLAVRRRERQ